MLKILLLKEYKKSGIVIIIGLEIFKLGFGIGFINSKYEGILGFGLITYYDVE